MLYIIAITIIILIFLYVLKIIFPQNKFLKVLFKSDLFFLILEIIVEISDF
jgi:hypothetical protein